MHSVKLTIQYDGTDFNGWQIQTKQPSSRTVQFEVEKALAFLTGEMTKVTAAGRTDAGVHARGQVISFSTGSSIPVDRYPAALNGILANDIVVVNSEQVPDDFHARYWVKEKTYIYRIMNSMFPDVFNQRYVYHIRSKLDVGQMALAARAFEGNHNFSSFCASGSSVKSFDRCIKACEIIEEKEMVALEITADGFLYNMVRIIAGTLIEVGLGKRSSAEIDAVIKAKDRQASGHTAPPHGLTLEKVYY